MPRRIGGEAVTCINTGNAIVCVSPWARLKVGNRYITMDYHLYCGPSFYWDRDMTKEYEPSGVDDPIWPVFEAWLKKYEAARVAK